MDCASIFLGRLLLLVLSGVLALEAKAQDRYWIFLNDNGLGSTRQVSHQAQIRRHSQPDTNFLTQFDTGPSADALAQIERLGLAVHVVSFWLDAVSVSGSPSALQAVLSLPFVDHLQPVATFRRPRLLLAEASRVMTSNTTDYGPSYTQLHLCQVDSLHGIGYTGAGIIVGVMDTGFDLDHPVFARIRSGGKILATRDFIDGDSDVQDQPGLQQSHGTAVLSVLAGYADGHLIGAAYDASFVLAKTEIYDVEIVAEEDNWVAAAEWMESLGVDIISSSLGYIDWYEPWQLDGQTCAITTAADAAVALGVVVVNAVGNERNTPWGAPIPPADGDSVFAVGALRPDLTVASFSSPGPTADGRIKPDIMALGVAVLGANYLTDGYDAYSGTSMATPIIAGGLALVKQAHPHWDWGKLATTLRSTGTNAITPNNDYGWGLAQFFTQFCSDGYFLAHLPIDQVEVGDSGYLEIMLYDSIGRPRANHGLSVAVLSGTVRVVGEPQRIEPHVYHQNLYFPFPGRQRLQVYDTVCQQQKAIEVVVQGTSAIFLSVAPNPAVDSVVFSYGLPGPVLAKLRIYSASADEIVTFELPNLSSTNRFVWHPRAESGFSLASGIYLACLTAASHSRMIKFAYIRN